MSNDLDGKNGQFGENSQRVSVNTFLNTQMLISIRELQAPEKFGYTQNASLSKIFLQTIQKKNRRHGESNKQLRMDSE